MSLYPSYPALRMAYDRDSSTGFFIDSGGAVTTLSTGAMQVWNNESSDESSPIPTGSSPTAWYLGVLFPETRDLVAYYLSVTYQVSGGVPDDFQTSTNTTSGVDGAWVGHGVTNDNSTTIAPDYRSSITSLAVTGIKGIRIHLTNAASGTSYQFRALHLYGQPSSGQNPNSLRPWHPTLNQQADGTTLDFGDIARGATATLTYRIHNMHSTLTARSITITEELLTDSSPTDIGQFALSYDNVTFTRSINIGDLTPGATSSLIYVKNSKSPTAQVGQFTPRFVALASSWS